MPNAPLWSALPDMFTSLPYATLTQVKTALDAQTTNDDTWLQELLTEAQDAIDKEVGYSFQTDGSPSSPALRLYDGRNLQTLLIDPCVSFSQVQETTYNLFLGALGSFQGNAQMLDITADCILAPNNTTPGYQLKRLSGMAFQQGTQNYKVSGIFGYPTIPPDISRACVRLTVHYVKMRDTNYADMVAETGGVRQHYSKPMPADVVEILQRYKKRTFRAY